MKKMTKVQKAIVYANPTKSVFSLYCNHSFQSHKQNTKTIFSLSKKKHISPIQRVVKYIRRKMNSSASKACWMVAASVGVVEALKDQGICRWNNVFRSVNQHAKTNLRSYLQAKRVSTSASASAIGKKLSQEKMKQSEESLRKVMYLSCWGPN